MSQLPTWEELPEDARRWMKFLGDFTPTTAVDNKSIKGSMADLEDGGCCETYLDSDCLRELALSCMVVAKWLDQRAKENP